MVKGKPWTIVEERELLKLRGEGKTVNQIACKLQKSEGSIKIKLARLGFKQVVVTPQILSVTTSNAKISEIIVPAELFSIEEALREEAAAMIALKKSGISKAEVARLKAIIQAAGDYQERYARYLNYRSLERWLSELDEKYSALAKRNTKLGSESGGESFGQ
jgi:hypothetical protein